MEEEMRAGIRRKEVLMDLPNVTLADVSLVEALKTPCNDS